MESARNNTGIELRETSKWEHLFSETGTREFGEAFDLDSKVLNGRDAVFNTGKLWDARTSVRAQTRRRDFRKNEYEFIKLCDFIERPEEEV